VFEVMNEDQTKRIYTNQKTAKAYGRKNLEEKCLNAFLDSD
jgi:hypothetical protein